MDEPALRWPGEVQVQSSRRLGAERGRGRGPYGGVAAAPARAAPNRRTPRASSPIGLAFPSPDSGWCSRRWWRRCCWRRLGTSLRPGHRTLDSLPCRGAALLSAAVRPPDPPTQEEEVSTSEFVCWWLWQALLHLQLPLELLSSRSWHGRGAGRKRAGTCFFHLIVDRPFDRPEDYV